MNASLLMRCEMSINQVQFQRGLSMAGFMERYGTEEKCDAALVASRWPDGFRCPECGDERHSRFVREGRAYWQCHRCRHQTTVTVGTIFDATKLPLTRWFIAVHLMTQAKNNVSALELKTAILGTYHAFKFAKYADRYLAEVQYRFNRRFDLGSILVRLVRAAALTRPRPESIIRLAEVGG